MDIVILFALVLIAITASGLWSDEGKSVSMQFVMQWISDHPVLSFIIATSAVALLTEIVFGGL